MRNIFFSSMASILTFQHHTSRMTGVGVAFTQTINGLYNKVKVVWVEKEVSFPSIKNKIKLNLLKEIFCERLPLTCVCGSTTADKWRLMPRPHCAQCSECQWWVSNRTFLLNFWRKNIMNLFKVVTKSKLSLTFFSNSLGQMISLYQPFHFFKILSEIDGLLY